MKSFFLALNVLVGSVNQWRGGKSFSDFCFWCAWSLTGIGRLHSPLFGGWSFRLGNIFYFIYEFFKIIQCIEKFIKFLFVNNEDVRIEEKRMIWSCDLLRMFIAIIHRLSFVWYQALFLKVLRPFPWYVFLKVLLFHWCRHHSLYEACLFG